MFFLIFTMIWIPVALSFPTFYSIFDGFYSVEFIFEYLPSFIFFIDIFVALNTGFYEKSEYIHSRKAILKVIYNFQ